MAQANPQSENQQAPGAPPASKPVPPDFPKRIATKVVFVNERERDTQKALEKIGEAFLRNLSAPDRIRYFLDMIDVLLDDDETVRFAGLSWVAITLDQSGERFEKFLDDVLNAMIEDHTNVAKPMFELEYKRKHFSAYARTLGDVFISMMQINSELYEVISSVYAMVIRKEMAMENQRSQTRDASGRRVNVQRQSDGPKAGKKLFDDVVDYIHARGEVRSDTLNQQNPNEFILILADRMRGTRRYVIQDLLNRQAADRRKEAEKELSEKLAGAEEIMTARDNFKKAVNLFWTEKRYNFKYLSVEKVRVTVQVLAVIIGIFHFLAGYLGVYGMLWWEGIIIAAGMYLYARFLGSRQAFRRFFPDDVSKELEVVVGSITPTFRKMSKEQLDAFLIRQVKDQDNFLLLPIFPEFLKYVFAVMPDRKNTIIKMDELADVVQNMELDIARVMRSNQPRQV